MFSQFGMSADDLVNLQTKIHTEKLAIAKRSIEESDELTRFRTQITRGKMERLSKTLEESEQKIKLLSAHPAVLGGIRSEWDSVVGPLMNEITNHLVLSLNLCHCLMEKSLIYEMEWEDIECQPTSRDKVHTLIWKYLSKRGPGSLEAFCNALEALMPPNTYLSRLIREKRENLMSSFVTQTDEDLCSASRTSASSNNEGSFVSAESSRSVGPFELRSPESRSYELGSSTSGSSVSEGGSESKRFYDAVLSCNVSDLCGDRGEWQVELPRGHDALKMKPLNGVTIGILGHFNRGKTWITSRLAKYDLPSQGMTSKTEGLSFKWISTTDGSSSETQNAHYHVLIDTAGSNHPIVWKDKDLRFPSKLYEDFIHSMALQLSEFIIFIMNEMTFGDELFLLYLIDRWSSLCRGDHSKCKEIFVIHNFRFSKNADERDTLFEKNVTAVYKGRYFLDPDEGINYFRRGVEDNTVGVRHVCLMLNEGEGRNYNEKVFLVLRKWITVLRRLDSGSKSLCAVAEQIALHATILLNKGFLRNVEKIRTDINIESNTLVFRPIKRAEDQPIKLVVPHPDHFYGKIKEYNPSAFVATYRTKKGQPCRFVFLEVPGSLNDIRVSQKCDHSETKPGHVVVQVTGMKTEPRLFDMLSESLDPDRNEFLPAGKADYEASKVVSSDTCVYGTFSQIFHIPFGFKIDQPRMIRMNGTLILLFRSEDDIDNDVRDTSDCAGKC
ncbi:uncharacterized protein [Oscarella lobularis]|uniref:uncharacterized protein isoform X2 n=1 Tax=Oscarella lobularis TaxID=121494 RepID=UPI003313E874